jgi:hypothetical protein
VRKHGWAACSKFRFAKETLMMTPLRQRRSRSSAVGSSAWRPRPSRPNRPTKITGTTTKNSPATHCTNARSASKGACWWLKSSRGFRVSLRHPSIHHDLLLESKPWSIGLAPPVRRGRVVHPPVPSHLALPPLPERSPSRDLSSYQADLCARSWRCRAKHSLSPKPAALSG